MLQHAIWLELDNYFAWARRVGAIGIDGENTSDKSPTWKWDLARLKDQPGTVRKLALDTGLIIQSQSRTSNASTATHGTASAAVARVGVDTGDGGRLDSGCSQDRRGTTRSVGPETLATTLHPNEQKSSKSLSENDASPNQETESHGRNQAKGPVFVAESSGGDPPPTQDFRSQPRALPASATAAQTSFPWVSSWLPQLFGGSGVEGGTNEQSETQRSSLAGDSDQVNPKPTLPPKQADGRSHSQTIASSSAGPAPPSWSAVPPTWAPFPDTQPSGSILDCPAPPANAAQARKSQTQASSAQRGSGSVPLSNVGRAEAYTNRLSQDQTHRVSKPAWSDPVRLRSTDDIEVISLEWRDSLRRAAHLASEMPSLMPQPDVNNDLMHELARARTLGDIVRGDLGTLLGRS